MELLVQPPDQVGVVHFCYKSLCPAEVVGQYLSPFQDSLPGLGLEAGQARPPDLETAVAVLEAHGDQVRPIFIKKIFPTRISFNIPNKVELAPVLASLPASTSLHRLAGFLTGSLEARLASDLDFSCDFFVTKALHREI